MKLIQEEYEARQKTVCAPVGHSAYNSKVNVADSTKLTFRVKGHEIRTRAEVANEHGITETAVRNSVEWGRGVDAAEEVKPGFTSEILSRKVKATKTGCCRSPQDSCRGTERGSGEDHETATLRKHLAESATLFFGVKGHKIGTRAEVANEHGITKNCCQKMLLNRTEVYSLNWLALLRGSAPWARWNRSR